jgi:hypothetical protein
VSNVESANLVARYEVTSHELASEDRSWLDERLEEYSELLKYLHDH